MPVCLHQAVRLQIFMLFLIMRYNITAEFKRTAVDRSCKGIIHNKRNSIFMCNICKGFNIKHIKAWIRNCFTENTFRVRLNGSLNFLCCCKAVNRELFPLCRAQPISMTQAKQWVICSNNLQIFSDPQRVSEELFHLSFQLHGLYFQALIF